MRDISSRCIEALLTSCADGDTSVRDQAHKSLCAMALKDVVGILRACEQWLSLRKPSTTTNSHRQSIVKVISAVLGEQRSSIRSTIPSDMRDALIACAFSEMTANNNDLTLDWAKDSCALFVELAGQYPKHGMNALLNPITSSAIPNFYVLQAIADVAQQYPLRVIPYVKEALAKLLPILSLAKQDNHRMVFAHALGSLADAVLRACDGPHADPPTPRSTAAASATRDEFADAMYQAIGFIMGDWSRSSEQRVRIPVVYALGMLLAGCSDANRVTLIPKVLPLIVNGVKREKSRDLHLPARGLMAALAFATSDEVSLALNPHMELTIMPLLVQSIATVMGDKEYFSSVEVKQAFGSLMNAAERLGEFHIDGFTSYISKMLDAKSTVKDPSLRASALQALRHIISRPALEPRIEPYKDTLIATIKLAQNDGDWRVRLAVVSCVVALGNSSIRFLETVGGADLMNNVVRSAAVTDNSSQAEELRDQARNALALFSASAGGKLDSCLWPFLLEHFTEHASNPALLTTFPTICRCLVQIGARVSQTENYYVDFGVSVNVPKPQSLTAKFLVQCMQIEHYGVEELHTILEAMATIGPLLDDPFAQGNVDEVQTPVANVWLAMIPELQKVLMSGEASQLQVEEWEELVSKLVTKTMTCKQNEQWVEDVTAATRDHLPGYQGNALMFRSALLVMGIGIGRSSKKDFVQNTVDVMIDQANHDNAHHRVGLSKAFGYIAALHPDLVSDKTALLAKGPEKRSFFASRDKNKKELSEQSRSIASFGLCYAARRMQSNIFSSRLDAVLLPTLSAVLNECKLFDVRESTLDALLLLEVAIRKQVAAPVNGTPFHFKGRDAFLEAIIKAVPIQDSAVKPNKSLLTLTVAAFRAIRTLIAAAPSPAVSQPVADKCAAFVLQYVNRGWSDIDVALEDSSRTAACEALGALFEGNPKLELDTLVLPFLAQTVNVKEVERERAVILCVSLFAACADRAEALIQSGEELKHAVTVGPLLGRLIPRVMDSNAKIRTAAMDGIRYLLSVVSSLFPEMMVAYSVDMPRCIGIVEALQERVVGLVRDGTQSAEKEVTYITKTLCMQVVAAIPDPQQFSPLLDTLLASGITDPQDDAASCSTVVLHGMIRGLGSTIAESNAKKHLENLLEAVDKVKQREQSLNGILVSIRNIAKHHSLMAFNVMLKQEVPHSESLIKAFQSVANDTSLATMFVHHCLDLVLNSQLSEERPDAKDPKKLIKGLANIPLSAICAFGWIVQNPKGAEAACAQRADIYCTLLLYLTFVHEYGDTKNLEHVIKALKIVVGETAAEVTSDRFERYGWKRWSNPKEFPLATMELVKYLCREELGDTTEETDRGLTVDPIKGLPLPPAEPTSMAIEMAQFILPYANKPIRSFRRTAIHICSTLVLYSIGEKKLLQSLATTLLSRSGSDEDAALRAEALEAFPLICSHPYAQSQVYISPMLSALTSNFSDANMTVSHVSMQSAYDLMDGIQEKEQVAPIAVNIMLKAKPLFESKDKLQRQLAYDVYRLMVQFANENVIDSQTMDQQMYLHFVTVLVHCEEDEESVRVSVKKLLQACATYLQNHTTPEGAKALGAVFSKPSVQPTATMNFEEFTSEFSYCWIAHFGGRINDTLVSAMSFFQHEREVLRSAAVVLCGNILRHLPPAEMGRAHVDQLCNALMALMNPSKEKSPAVRAKVAKAFGLLREL